MEAYLNVYGYEEEGSKGWNNVLLAFAKFIPQDLRFPLVHCYCDAVLLNSYEGDSESWKKMLKECLAETEKTIFRAKSVIEEKMKKDSVDKQS